MTVIYEVFLFLIEGILVFNYFKISLICLLFLLEKKK